MLDRPSVPLADARVVRRLIPEGRDEPPSIVFNHLADPQDARDLIAGVRLARELNRQAAWNPYRGEEISPGNDAVSDRRMTWVIGLVRVSWARAARASGRCRLPALTRR